jgi:hypothetical protein
MNTYLREFVRVSIEDWVSFMKSFTVPKVEKGELWKVPSTPMIVVHLNFKMTEKDEKKKKKPIKKKDNAEGEAEDSDDDQNKITYFPKLSKVESFFKNALSMIVTSTNKVSNLEDDLMPFLQKEKQPNFPITEEFPWVVEAKEQIQAMFNENIVGP